MKSIKEKAEAVFDDPFKQECFAAGANYVLECIENALNKSFDELSIKDGYLGARKCIEQLKE